MKKIIIVLIIWVNHSYSQAPIRLLPLYPIDTLWGLGPRVEIYKDDTLLFGDMNRMVKYLIREKMHSDSILVAAEKILSTIRVNGYISDWKNFKKYTKEYQRLKGYK